jgi:adenosylhomocysteine nucleosidase
MKLGIIGAMPQEIDLIVEHLDDGRVTEIAGRAYHEGRFEGVESVVVFSRWGKVAAASTATALIDRFGVDIVIFTGVAGAISPALNVGDVVIADRLMQHDFDVSPTGLFAKYEIPLLGMSHFPVNDRLVELARQAAEEFLPSNGHHLSKASGSPFFSGGVNSVYVGTIASGDQFIAHPDKLAELRTAIPDLLCIEMEGAAVAQVCHEYGVPFAVIRTISDKADQSAAMDFISFVQQVARHYSYGILSRMVANLAE